MNQNSIEVTTDEKLNIDLIKIELSISATNFKNIEVFNNSSKSKIPKGYGENDWNLYYDGKYYGTIKHFKTNNWHDHDYFFHFYESENEIKCNIKINGPDEGNLTLILDKI